MESKRVIFIPNGSTKYIVNYLNKDEKRLNFIDYFIISYIGYPQAGWIDLKDTSMSKYNFLYKICTSKAALKNVTLVPGETYYFFLKEISQKLGSDFEELKNVYKTKRYKLDGNILPQTYSLPIGMKADDVISYLFSYTDEKYKEFSLKIFGKYEKVNWYKYITIASIIQKEAANSKEMPTISSVIYNRLEKNMKLQMDGTLNYGEFSHTAVTTQMIQNDNSSYNTYKYIGIPSDPVCAVSFDSIKAAIFPKKTNFLYFVTKPNLKEHIFTTNLKSHNAQVNKYKKALRKIKQNRSKNTQNKLPKVTEGKKVIPKNSIKDIWKNVNTGN
jgi:UPF0755 protein